MTYLPLWLGAVLVGTAYGSGAFEGIGQSNDSTAGLAQSLGNANFGFCHTGGGYNCVVDGDTIWLKGQKIRVADIDAPRDP